MSVVTWTPSRPAAAEVAADARTRVIVTFRVEVVKQTRTVTSTLKSFETQLDS
jgi:hypothetical protein